MKIYITTIVPDTSKEVSTPLFKLVTLVAPTKEGILNFLAARELDPYTCYLGNQPAIDVLTTDGIFNEFYHIREQLIVPVEETPFPDPIQGIQRVGVNLNLGTHQQGWIEVQCLPVQSLHSVCTEGQKQKDFETVEPSVLPDQIAGGYRDA